MNETTDAPSIFAPLWRRKWLILLVGILVAAGTYLYYKRQAHVYSATTQLFLGSGTEEQAQVNGGSTKKKTGALNSTNQAALINSNVVREVVHRRLRAERKQVDAARVALHGKAKATTKEKNDFIIISTQARTAKAAALLANVTAQTYIKRQAANYQAEVEKSIALTRRQLRRIEAAQEPIVTTPQKTTSGKGSSTTTTTHPAKSSVNTAVALQAASLTAKINQLESQLSVTNVKQLEPAKANRAQLVKPKPRQNAIFGFAVGILLASIIAYVLSRLDRRLRSLAQIEAVFQAPILTALPAVRRPVVDKAGRPAPANSLREPIRRLHMNLKVGAADNVRGVDGVRPSVILFVSADPGDGKSTVVADLALEQRDAGEGVAVLEADFRRPQQAKLLGIRDGHGLAEVLEGRVVLDVALQRVEPLRPADGIDAEGSASGGLATMVESSHAGSLSVLLGGAAVTDPPALLARPAMAELLRSLAAEFDFVLVDAPVPLQVSDALPLLGVVDGIVIVARVGHTSQTSAGRLVQLLARTPSAPVLGVVANAVPRSEASKYGYSPASDKPRWYHKLTGR